jgi:hypothetical protein
MPFPVRVIRNTENRTFSAANGQGVAVANGALVCFLNNDVEPITEHWLGSMVATMDRTGAAAVGARLIYPIARHGPRSGARYRDLSLQHRGVDFDRSKPVPMPRPMGPGTDPMSSAARAVEERVAVTAACLLIDRRAYDAIGGMSPDYDYGLEDVDLCLRLLEAGERLVYDGMAALWHHESATRMAVRVVDPTTSTARRIRNHKTFVDRWGPRIYRETMLDAINGGTVWSETPLHVGIVPVARDLDPDPGHGHLRLVAELRERGWQVSLVPTANQASLDPTIDVVLVLDPSLDMRVLGRKHVAMAWIAEAPEQWLGRAWFDDFDIVLVANKAIAVAVASGSANSPTVASHKMHAGSMPDAAVIAESLKRWVSAIRFGVPLDVTDGHRSWGDRDEAWARALQRGLERRGHPTRVHGWATWEEPVTAREDVAVHWSTTDVSTHRVGQLNLILRTDDRVVPTDGYDVVVSGAPVDETAGRLTDIAESLLAPRRRRVLAEDAVDPRA